MVVVNFDFVNDLLSYKCVVDIFMFIIFDDVMENFKFGLNGGFIYCIEYFEKNFDWLERKLKDLKGYYFLFDCFG